MILRAIIILALSLPVASCGTVKNLTGIGGPKAARALPYKARLAKGSDRREFTVAVTNKGAGVAEVRESVRFPATEYCLFQYGSSDAEWDIDPVTGDWAFEQDGGKLLFAGRCTAR